MMGKYERAKSEFETACRLETGQPIYFQNLAKLYQTLGRYQDSIAVYQRCLVLSPGNFEVMNDLGISLAMAGRREEAVKIWRKILEKNPNFLPAVQNLRLAEKSIKGRGERR